MRICPMARQHPHGKQAARAGSDPGSACCRQGKPLTGLWLLHKILLPNAGLAPSLGHGCVSAWTRMLDRAPGGDNHGTQGSLLQRSTRWLPGPGPIARSDQESQSHTLILPQLTSGFGPRLWCCTLGLPLGKFTSLFALQHCLGAWDPTVQELARQPCPPCPGDTALWLQAGRDRSHRVPGASSSARRVLLVE